MAAVSDLVAAGIVEKDKNNDVLWTWSYPVVSSNQREHVLSKLDFNKENGPSIPFLYGQWKDVWYYSSVLDIPESETALPEVVQITLVLFSKDFNPEKYSTLCHIFLRQYTKTGNASSILETYLAVVTRGVCNSEENGKFSVADYGKQQAFAKCCMKEIIQTFGVESILIFTAMLLKKRIVMYMSPHSLSELLDYTRSIPAFAWHRQNWNVLHPYVHLTDADVENLTANSHYVAGFTEAAVEGRSDLYDIYVNVPNSQITVAPHAKESLAMGKLHKDMAMMMVEKAEDESLSDQDIIKAIAQKTKDLLNNLKGLTTEDDDGKHYLTLEMLKERKMPPATENFLFNLAACEGFVKL